MLELNIAPIVLSDRN